VNPTTPDWMSLERPYSQWTLATCWQLPATGDCSVRQMVSWLLSCQTNGCLGPLPGSTGRREGDHSQDRGQPGRPSSEQAT